MKEVVISVKKRKKRASKGEALRLVIIGLFLGTVFTFGVKYWNADVKQSDAVQKEAIFDSYKETSSIHSTKGIYVYFLDCDQLHIDAACVNEKVRADLNHIESGTEVTLVIHPNSDTILDMRIGKYVILEFENTMDKISKEANGYFVIGLMLYAAAIYGSLYLIPKRKRK